MLFYLVLKTTWLACLMRITWNPISNKAEHQENHKTVGESHCAKQMEQWHLNWCRTLWNFNFYILENDNCHLKVETVKHWKCHLNCTILQFSSTLALVFHKYFKTLLHRIILQETFWNCCSNQPVKVRFVHLQSKGASAFSQRGNKKSSLWVRDRSIKDEHTLLSLTL